MPDFNDADVFQYLLGDLSPDSPLYAQIHQDFIVDPDEGIVANIFKRWNTAAIAQAEHQLEKIWTRVMSLPNEEFDDPAISTTQLPAAQDVADYWLMDEYDWSVELSKYDEAELVTRGSSQPLEPFRELLRDFVSAQWNWPLKRSLPEYQDPLFVARSLAAALRNAKLPIPFPPELLATILVKSGLDAWCE